RHRGPGAGARARRTQGQGRGRRTRLLGADRDRAGVRLRGGGMTAAGNSARGARGLSRSQARLAAVQALYQVDVAETDLAAGIDELKAQRLGREVDNGADNGAGGEADPEHFAGVLKGVVRRQREIDPLIDRQLARGWRLTRIDSILRAILRAGAFELIELS